MRNLLASLVVALLLISCSSDDNKTTDLRTYIPEGTHYLLKSRNLSDFFSDVDSTSFFRKNSFLIESPAFQHLKNLNKLSKTKSALVCFIEDGQNQYHYLLISKEQPKIKTDSIKNRSRETLQFETFELSKIGTEDLITYTAQLDGVFLASNSQELLKRTITESDKNKAKSQSFEMAWSASDQKGTSLFINHTNLDDFFNKFVPEASIPLKNLGNWSVLDLEISGEDLLLHGIVSSDESAYKILDIFQEIEVEKNQIAQITPASALGFFSFTYSNMSKLHRNLNKFRRDSLEFSPNHLLNFTKEAGLIFLGEENILALTTTDPELAKGALSGIQQVSEFRGIKIMENPEPDEFSKILHPLMKEENLKFYAFVDHFLLYAGSMKSLEKIITDFQNNTILEKQQYYQKAVSNLAGSSSLLFVANTLNLKKGLKNSVSDKYRSDLETLNLEDHPILALQFVQENNFSHIHGVLNAAKHTPSLEIRQIASIQLNSTIGILPILMKNHTDEQSEILVQDSQNVLYLYSSTGNLKWKKKLDIRIDSEVHQVDLFKNGNLQFVFNTPNTFHVIDRNGNSVKPFPLEFKDAITLPISVFDYDNNRNYRFVIPQQNTLLMYDSKGKRVSGFEFEKTSSEIVQSPKHIRLKNKDYIVFPESNGTLNILSRQGKPRIKVKDKIAYSDTQWYQNNGKFVSVNAANQLVYVDQTGKVQVKAVTLNVNLQLVATAKTLVTLSENVLTINDTEVTLDYGLYTQPKIFELGNKTYIAVNDTQAQRIFIFDENAMLIPGFPVFGSSTIDMRLENGGALMVTVMGEEDTVLVYRM